MKTLGIVQACFPDATGIQKVLRQLHGKTVLEWVVRRVTDSTRLDGVIVVTDDSPASRLVRSAVPPDVPIFAGPQPDPLSRFIAALERYPAEAAVRVRADNPFVDPSLIDRLISSAEEHPECDYVSYTLRDGRPAILSPVGLFAEWFRVRALRHSSRWAEQPEDRQAVTQGLYGHPESFQVRLLAAPARIDRDDVRLIVERSEDWEHALAIFEALGWEEFDWQRIANLLDHQPDLRQRMADLNRAAAVHYCTSGE